MWVTPARGKLSDIIDLTGIEGARFGRGGRLCQLLFPLPQIREADKRKELWHPANVAGIEFEVTVEEPRWIGYDTAVRLDSAHDIDRRNQHLVQDRLIRL